MQSITLQRVQDELLCLDLAVLSLYKLHFHSLTNRLAFVCTMQIFYPCVEHNCLFNIKHSNGVNKEETKQAVVK